MLAEAAGEAVGGVFWGKGDAVRGGGFCVDGVGFGGGAVGSAEESLEAVLEDEGGGEGFGEGMGLGVEARGFGFGFFGEDEVFAGFGGGGSAFAEERHSGVGSEVVENPNGIADDFPLGSKVDVFFGDEGASEKGGGGEDGECVDLGVPGVWNRDHAGAEVVAVGIDDDGVAEEHFRDRMGFEEFRDGGEGAWEVLVVGVEIGANVASGAGEAAVDGVIHSGVGF